MSSFARSRWSMPVVLVAAGLPFLWAVTLAPRAGVMPLLELGMLAGPLALGGWLAFKRPIAILTGAYIGLAPIDFLLIYSSGITISRLIGLLAVVVLLGTVLMRGISAPLPRSALVWIAAFGFMVVTLVWSADQSRTLERLMSTGLPILMLALAAVVPCDRTDLRAMLLAVVGAAVVVSAYGIMNPPAGGLAGAQHRMVLRSGNAAVDPNGLAFSLMAPLGILLAVVLSPGRAAVRVGAAALALVVIGGVLLTESRGGLLGLLAMLVWFAVRSRERLIALLTLAGAVLISVLQGGAWQRLFSHSSSDVEGAGRLPIWSVGVEAFRQHWLLGNGYGTFTDAFNQVYLLVPHAFHTGWSREAHNMVISTFTELGIFGGALVMYAWWTQFRALRDVPREDDDGWLRLAMEAGVLGVFVTSMFLDILVLKPAWVLPILIVVIIGVRHRERVAGAAAAAAAGAARGPEPRAAARRSPAQLTQLPLA